MGIPVLLRFVVLSITGVAGLLLIETYLVGRLRGKKMLPALLIGLYLCVYWGVVYAVFLEG